MDPLPDPMALRLFADRGTAARPGFRIEDDEAAAAEICRRLDGLPLAIELAAARLRMLTPRQIADRLDDRFRLLTGGSRTVLPRQQTLRAVVDWSWDLLDDAERTVLRRLSVFAGGCDLAAAEAVCSGPQDAGPDDAGPGGPGARPAHPGDVADSLGSLIDKSLVVAAPAPDGPMRYRLLETVGEYAAERLDEAGERAAVERRHLVHYREVARTTDPLLRGPEQRAAIDLFEREYENLRTAMRRAVAARDEQEALHVVLSLAWYWQMRDLRVGGPALVLRRRRARPGSVPAAGRGRAAGLRTVHGRPAAHGARAAAGGPALRRADAHGLHEPRPRRVDHARGHGLAAQRHPGLRPRPAADLPLARRAVVLRRPDDR